MSLIAWPTQDGGRFTANARKRCGRIRYKCVPEGGARELDLPVRGDAGRMMHHINIYHFPVDVATHYVTLNCSDAKWSIF